MIRPIYWREQLLFNIVCGPSFVCLTFVVVPSMKFRYIYNYSLTFPLLNRNCCLLVVLRMYTTPFTELEILKPFQWNYGRLVNLFDVC